MELADFDKPISNNVIVWLKYKRVKFNEVVWERERVVGLRTF